MTQSSSRKRAAFSYYFRAFNILDRGSEGSFLGAPSNNSYAGLSISVVVNFSTVDKLFSVFDDGSNPMYSNPPKGKSLTLKNFPQVAQYAGLGYNHGMKGPIIITEGTLKNGTLQKEDSGLGLDIMFSAHRNSYFREKTWGKYDVLGSKAAKPL